MSAKMERDTNSKAIESLKAALEKAVDQKISVSGQFDTLRDYIFSHTGQFVSTTTLKRMWGYLSDRRDPHVSTLSLLAKTLGFSDWDDFVAGHDKLDGDDAFPSNPKLGGSINVSSDLKPGDRLKLFWFPERECVVEYLGGIDFRVIESKKTKLKPGDLFSTHLIVSGHPLYLSNLTRRNLKPMVYICGRLKGGIQYIKTEASDNPDTGRKKGGMEP